MADIPRPVGVTARHAPGWGYLTVPRKAGYGQEVEHSAGGDWELASKQSGEWLVPIRQFLRTEWRARYTRSGQHGGWTTGRVWDDGFEEDGEQDPTPPAPENLTAFLIGGTAIRVTWRPGEVDAVLVSWRRAGQKQWSSKAVNRGEIEVEGDAYAYTLTGLARYARYDIAVRVVVGGVESQPAQIAAHTTGRGDGQWGPLGAEGLTADEVGATTVRVSWDQVNPLAVGDWQVGHRGAPWAYPTDQEYTFTGLTPATAYELWVMARGRDGTYSPDEPAKLRVTTSGGEDPAPPAPDEPRIVATDPAGGTATVGWVQPESPHPDLFWRVLFADEAAPRSLRRTSLTLRGLHAGVVYPWRVCAVAVDEDGIEHPSAWVTGPDITLDETPPPPSRPEPPTGLHVHCLADTSAKAEWDQVDVSGWRVWLDDPADAVATISTLVKLTGLLPGSEYTVRVAAFVGERGQPGYAESEPAEHTFTTLDTVLPPDDPVAGDLPAPSGLMVYPVAGGAVEAVWEDRRPDATPGNFYVASLDGVHWVRVADASVRFTDLQPGRHTVHVYGVMGGKLTGMARKATEGKEVPA